MSKPEDIPQDVWDAVEDMDLNIAVASATSTASRTERMRKSIIARVILAAKAEEREACALILEDTGIDIQDRFAAAEAIRKRGNVSTVRKSENQEG